MDGFRPFRPFKTKKGETNMITTNEIRTDEEIQKDVLAEFKWDARVSPNEIGVAVKDGVGKACAAMG